MQWGSGASFVWCRFPLFASSAAPASTVQGMIRRGNPLLALMRVPVSFHFGSGNDPYRAKPFSV